MPAEAARRCGSNPVRPFRGAIVKDYGGYQHDESLRSYLYLNGPVKIELH